MLTKYDLTNVPEGGVRHIVPGQGDVMINQEELTDAIADQLIALGVTQYFKPKASAKTTSSTTGTKSGASATPTTGSAGTKPATGTKPGASATPTTGAKPGASATPTTGAKPGATGKPATAGNAAGSGAGTGVEPVGADSAKGTSQPG